MKAPHRTAKHVAQVTLRVRAIASADIHPRRIGAYRASGSNPDGCI
ncbi:hypothetical protein AZ78_4498 [Lysobacter capsici AZ78]|uniref:Uncharacterized protein n=1 Tax=Lysobacter capsici AZ78 TaxID=1444315 RepID=A0A125MNL4_9GAMM|nr:hypothetical protein AZ78_4498 [Lysobacter capsici AZ78]